MRSLGRSRRSAILSDSWLVSGSRLRCACRRGAMSGVIRRSARNLRASRCMGPAFLFCLDFDANAGREGMSWESGKRKGESALLFALAADDGGSGFAVGFAAALGFALVPVLLAFRYCQFALDAAMAEVEAGGDERMSFDLRL